MLPVSESSVDGWLSNIIPAAGSMDQRMRSGGCLLIIPFNVMNTTMLLSLCTSDGGVKSSRVVGKYGQASASIMGSMNRIEWDLSKKTLSHYHLQLLSEDIIYSPQVPSFTFHRSFYLRCSVANVSEHESLHQIICGLDHHINVIDQVISRKWKI